MKVALVYDRVNKWGGAERVLLALHEIFPDAPLYTAVYDQKKASWASVFPKVIPSFLQKIPLAKNHHELFAWLTPLAFEAFNFDGYDLVISVTSAEAKCIITKPETRHVCICLTPTRYLWSGYDTYINSPGLGVLSGLAKALLPYWIKQLRQEDQIASQRPDEYIAISKTVQKRIKRYYKRESVVIYPGVDTDKFKVPPSLKLRRASKSSKLKERGYFLLVSRLVAYKRVDLAIEAFNRLEWKLKIVGIGSEENNLKAMAKENIEFLGELTDEPLVGYYQDCEALIFPGVEDFGLTSLEAQACGRPIIAFSEGGVRETVVEKKTGLFFNEPTPEFLIKTLLTFKKKIFLPSFCRSQAVKFNKEHFIFEIKTKILNEKKN